jgi:uncharacterized protein (TIGR02231 family)
MEMEGLPEIATEITAVTLYRDGARIERTGSMTLEPGTHKLRVSNLTQYLDKESVRVSGRGHATIVSFDVVDVTQETSGYANLAELVNRKEALEKEKQQHQNELTRLEARASYYAQILEKSAAEFSRWIPAGECEVEQLTKLETLTTTQLNRLEKTRIKLIEAIDKLQKDIAIVDRELAKFRSQVPQYAISNQVVINIDVQKAGDCQFSVTYFVRRASWAPSYDFDLSEEKAKVTLHTVVINNTQEDWPNVKLTVSTATSRPAVITEPSPYLIREYVPPVPTPRAVASRALGRKAKMDKAEGAALDDIEYEAEEVAAALPPPPPEMEVAHARTLETGGVHVFVLPNPVKVPADGEPHAFQISKSEFMAERKFFWNAVDFAEAIEVTMIENGDTVLLPGKARVYSGDDYLGETYLKLVAPREKVDVGTRFTYDLKVEKKLIAKGAEKAGLTRGKVQREYSYELTVTNFRKTPSPVKLMDRIPHSDSELIKVQSKKFSLDPNEHKLGILTWEFDVPASGELKITYTFEIEYPRGLRVTPPLP